ncbi:MAG: TonB-dependent receptor [Acidobacteriia bacterium]|nr:TonB-dependent receptor [Terriglobia bacterium]
MERQSVLRVSAAILAACVLAGGAAGQTTGRIGGAVTDESKGALPGVTVEAKSLALQGTRVTTTDAGGLYRLTLLPPGQYTITFTLRGFATETAEGVPVGLGKDTAMDVVMRPAVKESLVVSGEVPVVDVSSTTIGTNLTMRAIQTLPTGRNYTAIVAVAPGTSTDASNNNLDQTTITVYGSSGAENAYFIDGVNTTGMEYGFQGKQLNYEFIQELDVKTGGYQAEYGRATGGIINVITKSGGNEFHGDVFAYYDNDSLQSKAESVVSSGGTVEGFTKKDYGLDLGGYIVKDKLWFFGAYDQVKNTAVICQEFQQFGPCIKSTGSESKLDLGSAKLTWLLAPNQSLVATFFQDPRTDTGAISDADHTLNGDPLTYDGQREFGGRDYALSYEGIFGANWAASAQVARHEEKRNIGPATAAGDVIQYQDAANNYYQTGGFGRIEGKQFKRDFYGGSLSRFFGGHEIKFGAEYEKEEADVTKRYSGGQQVTQYSNLVDPSKPIYSHYYWTTPNATLDNAPISALVAVPKHRNTTLYLQDRWTVSSALTLNLGVRWDRQEIIDSSGVKQIDLKKDYAPRLGFVWDPSGTHRSKVYGSYGRFYEQLPMDLVIRSYSYERQPTIINYSPTDNHPDPAAEADYGTASHILGGFTEPADPNLRSQFVEEYILGAEKEVVTDIAVGVKGIYRSYGRVIEDFLCIDDGTYCIGNPGQGIMKRIYNLAYAETFPAPRPVRIFRGLQLDVTKRFSNNWQATASYLYSKLEGNFDGEFAPYTNVGADPNISAAYDYYDFFTNGRDLSKITNRGYLSNDRRSQFKVSGIYMTPFKLSLGVSAYWRTGTPLSRLGYSDAYNRWEFFLTQRGSEGRTPATYEADVHFGYPIEVKPVTINLLLDVFNVLNAQRPILLDQRWGFQESDNTSPTPVNPYYGKPVLRTPPTSVRLGVRLTL